MEKKTILKATKKPTLAKPPAKKEGASTRKDHILYLK